MYRCSVNKYFMSFSWENGSFDRENYYDTYCIIIYQVKPTFKSVQKKFEIKSDQATLTYMLPEGL